MVEEASAIELAPEDVARCQATSAIASIRIGEQGEVLRVKILHSDRPECRDAAKVLAEKSRFAPARDAEDQPVASTLSISIEFSFDEVP